MLFSDAAFLLSFLPLVLAVHFVVVGLSGGHGGAPRSLAPANTVLLGASLIFLAFGGGGELILALTVAAGLNYLLAEGIARAVSTERSQSLRAELWLTLGVWGNLVLLGIGRAFAADVLGDRPFVVAGLLAPIGLSVFTLHALSYLVDVYRREAAPVANPIQAGLYLLFFPLMVAGPIVRYRDLSAALTRREFRMGAFAYGVRRFVIGLAKVRLIAAPLGEVADTAFGVSAGELGAALAWLGLVCFALQVYFVLSGYADMAVGLGRSFGFRLKDNYRWPYGAESLHDFWRRWNISLVEWCRSYLMLQIEGDRTARTLPPWKTVALLVVVGVWHGATTSLVLWGAYHGVLVLVERAGFGAVLTRLPQVVRHGYLLAVVSIGWVLFRADTPTHAVVFWQALAGAGSERGVIPPGTLTPQLWWALGVGIVAAGRLPGAVSRWTVTLDAMTASVMMLVWATVLFCWRPVARLVDVVVAWAGREDE